MHKLKAKIKSSIQAVHASPTKKRRVLLGLSGAVVFAAIAYWIYGLIYISTDNAYINANVVEVAARVSGQVATLNVDNNQFVKTSQLLLSSDKAPYQVALDKARAQLANANANLTNSEVSEHRVSELVNAKVLPKQTGDDAEAKLASAQAAVDLAKADLKQAELNLEYTEVFASSDGWITNLTLRVGNVVTANQPLFALVSDKEYWVDANFKETELKHIKVQEKAEVSVDMYPGHIFHGVVESISSSSGAAFSLLPPQNAVGNWVKITQRVPVKIRILDPDAKYPLRVGTTATVKIKIK
jgi:membrane fusion protein, multidrug efflux system